MDCGTIVKPIVRYHNCSPEDISGFSVSFHAFERLFERTEFTSVDETTEFLSRLLSNAIPHIQRDNVLIYRAEGWYIVTNLASARSSCWPPGVVVTLYPDDRDKYFFRLEVPSHELFDKLEQTFCLDSQQATK